MGLIGAMQKRRAGRWGWWGGWSGLGGGHQRGRQHRWGEGPRHNLNARYMSNETLQREKKTRFLVSRALTFAFFCRTA